MIPFVYLTTFSRLEGELFVDRPLASRIAFLSADKAEKGYVRSTRGAVGRRKWHFSFFFSLSLCDETKTYKIICRASTLKIVCHLPFSPYQRAPPRPETVCRQIVYSRLLISAVVRSWWPLSTAMRTTLCVRSAYDDVARPLDAFRSRAYAEWPGHPTAHARIVRSSDKKCRTHSTFGGH
jgi:hypothetical protein